MIKEIYMIHVNSGSVVFVKEFNFFCDQGGFKQQWGNDWIPIIATSIEDARKKGCEIIPEIRIILGKLNKFYQLKDQND